MGQRGSRFGMEFGIIVGRTDALWAGFDEARRGRTGFLFLSL